MPITRRATLASLASTVGLAAFPSLVKASQPTLYRPALAPLRFSYKTEPFRACLHIEKVSGWRYQTIDPARDDQRGIIRHLPTGFTFLTVPDDGPSPDPLLDFHMAYCLFAPGEPIANRLA